MVTAGLEITELRLGLPGDSSTAAPSKKKRSFLEISEDQNSTNEGKKPVVGWPPVCSYRKNSFHERNNREISRFYVKISMDGAPYLRKIDLKMYNSYSELSDALEKMFGCFGNGVYAENENSCDSEYVPIYEDRDGDWMLVGDVPWEMFVESCRRLRIMKRSEGTRDTRVDVRI